MVLYFDNKGNSHFRERRDHRLVHLALRFVVYISFKLRWNYLLNGLLIGQFAMKSILLALLAVTTALSV